MKPRSTTRNGIDTNTAKLIKLEVNLESLPDKHVIQGNSVTAEDQTYRSLANSITSSSINKQGSADYRSTRVGDGE